MRVLLLNQAYEPDVVSSAQHAADLARELVRRGHEVTVICSRRPYNGGAPLPGRESRDGVSIRRIRSTALGKGSLARRAVDFATFGVWCALELAMAPAADVTIAMTSPPLIAALGAARAWLGQERLVSWVLDLNPDEALAAGALRKGSVAAGVLERLLRFSLQRSRAIAVMDRFMAGRVTARGIAAERVHVIPPWPHDVHFDEAGRTEFRAAHGLDGRFVVMYAGNHSPCHPLDTLLDAALLLREERDIAFCFSGGGSEFGRVGAYAAKHGLNNIVCTEYQPRERLSALLSAADMHAVVMGDALVGTVHPCKVYNAMALGLPLLYIGPEESHIADLALRLPAGQVLQATHGDARGVAQGIAGMAAGRVRRQERAQGSNALQQMAELVEQTGA